MFDYDNWKTHNPDDDKEECPRCGKTADLKGEEVCWSCLEELDPRVE